MNTTAALPTANNVVETPTNITSVGSPASFIAQQLAISHSNSTTVRPFNGHIKTAEQRIIIQQYGDPYTGP